MGRRRDEVWSGWNVLFGSSRWNQDIQAFYTARTCSSSLLSNQYPNLSPQLEEILSRNLVINITINLCTPTPPIPISEFEETMLHTASIYARAWPHIMYAQSLRQPRYQWDAWSIFSIQYIEPAVDSRGLRCEYVSFAKITTRPGSPMFELGISHARRMRYRFVREYGPFEAVEG